MPTPGPPESHSRQARSHSRPSCAELNASNFGDLATCGRRADRGRSSDSSQQIKRAASQSNSMNGQSNASRSGDEESAVLARLAKLEISINQQMLVQRNTASKQQLCVDALNRLEDMLIIGGIPAPPGAGHDRERHHRNGAERQNAEPVEKMKEMQRFAMQEAAELKATAGAGRPSALTDPLSPEAVRAVGIQCAEIDAVVRSVQDEVIKMSQHIHSVEQTVARQNGAIATCTETLSEELKKMEEQSTQAQEKATQERAAYAHLASVQTYVPRTPRTPRTPRVAASSEGGRAQPTHANVEAIPEVPEEPQHDPVRGTIQNAAAAAEIGSPEEDHAQKWGSQDSRPRKDSVTLSIGSSEKGGSSKADAAEEWLATSQDAEDDGEPISKDIFSRVANSAAFTMVASVMIILNMAFIGADVSMKVSWSLDLLREQVTPVTMEWSEGKKTTMVALEWVFVIWMSIEFIINSMFCVRNRWAGWRWNVFDAVLLLTTWLDMFQASVNFSFLRMGKLYRLIRVMRVGKILKTLRAFRFLHGVRKMVLSLLGSLTSLFWSLLLMTVIMYVVSLVMLQGIEGYLSEQVEDKRRASLGVVRRLEVATTTTAVAPPFNTQNMFDVDDDDTAMDALAKYYGGVGTTMFTLFRTISGGAEWTVLMEPVAVLPGGVGLFSEITWLAFIGFMIFGVLNVLTGVFCDAAMKAASEDKDMAMQELMNETEQHVRALRTVFMQCDGDGSGTVDKTEFDKMVDTPEVCNTLMQLGIEAAQAKELFTLLDDDDSGTVGIEEFVSGCLRMKGGAKGVDVVTLIFESKKVKTRMEKNAHCLADLLDEVRLMQGKPAMPRDKRGP